MKLLAVTLLSCIPALPTVAAEVTPSVASRFATPEAAGTPDFQKHVTPLLGRLGCNGRACHGSFQGRGGFQLSLFGYDFKKDHEQIAGEDYSRIDPTDPAMSMLLDKPTLGQPHGGGKRMEVDSWQYNVLSRWVAAGAPPVKGDAAKLTRLEITPAEIVRSAAGATVPLKAVAIWADGSREDVTPLCRFQSNDDVVAAVDEGGVVTVGQAGDTHVVAFYDSAVVPVPVLRPVSDRVGPNYPVVPTPTKVDELVVAKLRKLGIVPSEPATDAQFLRRVSLDMAGTLPPAWEVEAFLADRTSDKRDRKIDELLASPAYAAWWTTRLCDWTGNNPDGANSVTSRERVAEDWYAWILQRVAANRPYDEIAAGLILATSRAPEESYTDYCTAMRDIYAKDAKAEFAARPSMPHYWARNNFKTAEDRAIGFAYTWMGLRIQCAQCHKHPFDQWTQDDFKQFENFFSRVTYGTPRDAKQEADALTASFKLEGKKGNQLRKELGNLLTKGTVVPMDEVYALPPNSDRNGVRRKPNPKRPTPAASARVLGGATIDLNSFEDARAPLMDWLRRSDNPYFARAFVNRVWSNYFNVGIVNPPDDLSLANPPSNAPLLDYLTAGFVKSGYDMKWLHREIARSDTYQRSWIPNATNRQDETNFSRCIPRRLPAEAAYDAVVLATSDADAVKALLADPSKRAIGIPGSGARYKSGNAGYALTVFGRSTRESNCECDRSGEASLLQTVFLQNDRDVLGLLSPGKTTWVGDLQAASGGQPAAEPATNDSAAQERKLAAVRQQLVEMGQRAAKVRAKGDDKQYGQMLARATAIKARLLDAERELRKQQAAVKAETRSRPVGSATGSVPTDPAKIVRQAYLRTLSREPTAAEAATATAFLKDAAHPVDAADDLLWALVNTKEFIVNH